MPERSRAGSSKYPATSCRCRVRYHIPQRAPPGSGKISPQFSQPGKWGRMPANFAAAPGVRAVPAENSVPSRWKAGRTCSSISPCRSSKEEGFNPVRSWTQAASSAEAVPAPSGSAPSSSSRFQSAPSGRGASGRRASGMRAPALTSASFPFIPSTSLKVSLLTSFPAPAATRAAASSSIGPSPPSGWGRRLWKGGAYQLPVSCRRPRATRALMRWNPLISMGVPS